MNRSDSVDPKRWSVVRRVFEELVELPLDVRHGSDAWNVLTPRERSEVESLLAFDAGETDTHEYRAPVSLATRVSSDPLDTPSKDLWIDDFHILRKIGAGGMGAVYEAEQANPRRKVAVKVLRPELCGGSALRRFEVEAEFLARLEHPNIARVLAAGIHATRSGPFALELPWYALELLEQAAPITTYADAHGLARRARIELVLEACAAMCHAHGRGVIHRDLKPANLLVDACGRLKVIDFGIARAVTSEDEEDTTRPGVILGTPRYMAPEQALGPATTVDVRADVFALGTVLRELLIGSATPAHQKEPRLPAELRWILTKATAEERERRYPTVEAFTQDLERHLRGHEVEAAPPSVRYLIVKRIKRHRVLLATTFVVVAALSTALWIALTSLARAEQETVRAQHERRLALRESERHEGFTHVLRSAMDEARSMRRGSDVTVRELLDQVRRQADRNHHLPAYVRSAVFEHIGVLAFQNGEHEQSVLWLERALDLLREGGELGGAPEVLTRANLADALRRMGRVDEATTMLSEALTIADRDLSEDDPARISAYHRRAAELSRTARFEEAVTLSRELLELRRTRFGEWSAEMAEGLAQLGMILNNAGRFEEAVTVLERARTEQARWLPETSDATLTVTLNLCTALLTLRRPEEAAKLSRPAAEAALERLGESHVLTLKLRRSFGQALRMSGHPREAIPILEACLATQRENLPYDHADVISGAGLLALAELEGGDANSAEARLRPYTDESFQDHPQRISALVFARLTYAKSLDALDRDEEAVKAFETTWQLAARHLGEGHHRTRDVASQLAAVHERRGRAEQAEAWLVRAGKR